MKAQPSWRLKAIWLSVSMGAALQTAGQAPGDGTGMAAPVTPTLTIGSAWSRATAPGAKVGVVYFSIDNQGVADELLAIESPAASQVEMHATKMVDGVMEMRRATTVVIPAKGQITFEPGGLHAMLMDLHQPLIKGTYVQLTMVFRRAGHLDAQAKVLDPGAMTGPPDPPAATHRSTAPRTDYRLTVWPPHAATPDFALVDAKGRTRTLASYRGRVVVLFFGFVHCPDFCPAELFKLGLVMKRLGAMAEHVQVLFITLDPARDTRNVIRNYVTAFDPRFIGLTGSASQIDRATSNFFVEYARVEAGSDYTIDHSTSTFVIDSAGRLRWSGP